MINRVGYLVSLSSDQHHSMCRDGGEVSKDAEHILVAYRQGKLSVISADGYRLSQTEGSHSTVVIIIFCN